jgi:hypothetical protein
MVDENNNRWIRITIRGLGRWMKRWGDALPAKPYRLLTGPDGRQWQLSVKRELKIRELKQDLATDETQIEHG